MAKAKLSFRNLSVPEKIAKLRQIITALTGNPDFPHPVPPLATLTAGTDDLETTYTTTQAHKHAWKGSLSNQATKEDTMVQLVSQIVSYVESVAGPNEALIASAGMTPRAVGGPSTLPDVPSDMDATIGNHEGELDLSWDAVSGARSYLIQQTTDPNAASSWTHAGTSTKSSITINGLTSGTRYWFRVSAVGAAGQSGWSDPATKIAP
jgi:hypothetical protein